MRSFRVSALLLAVLYQTTHVAAEAAPDEKYSKPSEPCTLHSPNTGSFYDLREISVAPPDPTKKLRKDQRTESWHARGYDYHANFTLNFCAPVIEELEDVVGVDRDRWRNISAYYEYNDKIYSIGQQSSEPLFRGRKLVLNYTDGSPCDSGSTRSLALDQKAASLARRMDRISLRQEDEDDDGRDEEPPPEDDDRDKPDDETTKDPVEPEDTRRKSTLISLLCERDPLAPRVAFSFVGSSPDECTYFFELRAQAACGGARDTQVGVGPGGVFGVIVTIAVLVYLVGGCVYQRTVMHARGWRQLPNYSMWAGIGGFIRDMLVILTSSCARWVPRNRGYRSITGSGGSGRGRQNSRNEDENRLIDQLDEEWEE
ncbi:MAG: hypothetical protein M4579_006810 [Chaenotheca gracillima]|nr:MAG: hypothetical protein M4579_006810 [Chaenotheca gracillima]